MTVFIDLIGSWFVRISLIVVMLTLIVNMNDVLYKSREKRDARTLIAVVDSVLYADINAAGYKVSWGSTVFVKFKEDELYFYADIDRNGTADYVKYKSDYSSSTQRYTLSRTVNAGTPLVLGSDFKNVIFKYYDATGVETATDTKIRQVKVTLSKIARSVTTPDSLVTADIAIFPPNVF